MAFHSFGDIKAPTAQPPFPPVENKVSNGGLTVLARVFTPGGWVKPGESFPVVLTYQAGAAPVAGVTISVTLNSASVFLQSTPAAASGNGTSGSPLVYIIPLVAANGTGQIVVEARAKTLIEDPEVMWKDVSSDVTLAAGGQGPLPARTHGPKVTTLETAVYGDRPFPVVMVQYQDIKHCTGAGAPFPECTGNHTAEALDISINSRTTGKSVWQLFQDESFGQLFPDGRVSPAPNSPTTAFTVGYTHKFSGPFPPSGTCNGTTLGPAYGTPAYANRIENGWYLLPGTQGYYGADQTGHALGGALTGQGLLFGIDNACGPTGKLAYDAASVADPDIDYNDFDTDKDGLVDFFNIVFAGDGGNGSASVTGINNVWPHSSDIRSYFTDANGETGYVSNDQFRNRLNQLVYWTDATRSAQTTTPTAFPVYVRVGSYNVNPEAAVESVSVIAHEYGHALGLPDYYSTGTRGTFGSWDLNGTDYFQYHSIFSRQDLGWLVPRPLTSGQVTMKESKFDTGEIQWNRPDGTPYTLTGPGIHNGDVYRLGLPPRVLIDEVPSGVRAWYSASGNDFGCNADGGGHNLDFFIPDLEQYGSATAVTLKIKHLYEIEWDYDYGFVLVSDDGGQTWTSLPGVNGSTTLAAINPNANACQTAYGNGITGVSDGDSSNDATKRATADYTGAQFVDEQFDLSAYKGKSIILRFSYSTDPGLAKRGWFIDDVEITADSTVVYTSDFEASDERTRIFPDGWVRISSSEGSPADHAYYLELRDRISFDFDGKGQSERGSPTFQGGVSMIYTDEAHGYGNFGVDDPPAQTPVDSVPEPGNESPDLNDAAFTAATGRNTFNGCTHIENYDAEPGSGTSIPWKLPPFLNFTVTGLTGMTGPGAPLPPNPATATLAAEIYPACDVALAPPVLSAGTDYENPDTDGAFTLTWTRPAGAIGPDLLQVATSCGPTFTDDASEPLVAGDNANWDGTPQWATQPNPSDGGNLSYYIPDGAAQDDSLVLKNAIAIPAGFTSTLTFTTRQGLEAGFDFGYVEVSTNGGTSWKTMASYSGPGELPNEVFVGARAIDLTEFAGQSVTVRFRLESDGFNIGQPAGWYIDNIAITNSDWTNVINTTGTSFLDHKPVGSYCYRVRTTFLVGQTAQASDFSNTVNITVAQVSNPTPTPSPTATPSTSPTPSASPTASPTATPTPTPSGTPAQLLNISTRLQVEPGDNVGIGGLIITGADPKRLAFRALGPSLSSNGTPVPGRLNDPVLELYNQDGQFITSNDDWKGPQQAEIQSSGFAPSDDRESVILRTVTSGHYTAIVRGKGNASGIALIEVYDRDGGTNTKMGNISSRGFVQTGDKILIGGFIAGHHPGATKVVLRAIGPSLSGRVPNYLADPTLELRDANGALVRSNDDWKNSTQRTEIEKTGLAPTHDAESALVETLAPANYTGIVRGKFNSAGIALVEIYNIK